MSKNHERAQGLADHYIDLLAGWAMIEKRPLFGAVALNRHDHVFAMVWHGALYFKVNDESQTDYVEAKSHALTYTSKGGARALKSFWEVPVHVIEDPGKLREWAQRAYLAALKVGNR